jgi:hypothetical protein
VGEPVSGVVKIRGEVAGQLGCPGSGGVVGDAEQVDAAGVVLDDECCVEALECDGVDVEEVDREKTVGLSAQERAPGAAAAGGRWYPWRRRIRRMVEAVMRCPSLRSSPWRRTTPQVRFSVARRRMSATISSLIGGRPGGFG